MPVHFNSFIADKEEELKTNLFSNIVQKYTQDAEDIFVSEDKKSIHMTNYIREINTNEIIGKVVITLKVRDNAIEIVDTDITIKNPNITKLHFDEKLQQSSEANEYYTVISDDDSHFQIETVNRYSLKSENIEGTDQKVYLSAFPFQLDLYSNENEMNSALGFKEPIKVGNTDMYVNGYSTNMMAVGNVLSGKSDEPSSFIIGIIEDYKDVIVKIADINISYTIIYINTAIGTLPVAVHRANFDLSKLQKGNILAMFADVKADFKE